MHEEAETTVICKPQHVISTNTARLTCPELHCMCPRWGGGDGSGRVAVVAAAAAAVVVVVVASVLGGHSVE
jgi:hypothetical protein